MLLAALMVAGSAIWAIFQWPDEYSGITGQMVPGSGIEEARES